jgi:transcriptional regulator with XRE-family HTH domain
VDVSLVIKQRLEELGLEQKDLAAAASVTDSYISQLLTRKKLPPAPDRSDIYAKMGKFLKLPPGKLSELAAHERNEELRRRLPGSPLPLFQDVRQLILRKCSPDKQEQIRAIFERHPFGEFERLVTQKLLDVAKRVAKEELDNERWLQLVAELNGRSYEEMRVIVLEFLDADILNISADNCISFLEPLIDSWDIDLSNFAIEIVLNRRLVPVHLKKLEFVESDPGKIEEEPGLLEFLGNPALSASVTQEELAFLKKLTFKAARPTALYYYRELQNLRDPLHFRESPLAPSHQYGDAKKLKRQMQLHARESAVQRWTQRNARRQPKPPGSKSPR